ncbi:hypothetical protein BY996DRAFT_6411622 [Phakopsora pachyrhizi]|nr:hypothetical protein BY996DRAFT_6411622 [Phakopsora pachyrhizi]
MVQDSRQTGQGRKAGGYWATRPPLQASHKLHAHIRGCYRRKVKFALPLVLSALRPGGITATGLIAGRWAISDAMSIYKGRSGTIGQQGESDGREIILRSEDGTGWGRGMAFERPGHLTAETRPPHESKG